MEYFVSSTCLSVKEDGTKDHPFSSVQELFKHLKINAETKIDFKIQIEKENGFNELSKAQLKKEMKLLKSLEKKTGNVEMNVKLQSGDKKTEQFATIQLDPSLPKAVKTELVDLKQARGTRVIVEGNVQHIRKQSKKLWFITLRDAGKLLQCVLENDLCQTKEASILACESYVELYGVIIEVPKGSTAEGGHEMRVDFWELIGTSPMGGIETVINKDSDVDVLFDNRHLMLRSETQFKIQMMSAVAEEAFSTYYKTQRLKKANLPAIVPNQCEGGSTLFKSDFYGEEVYLTQSSQLYLETMCPVLGNCYTIAKSFRAERSRTRRHLSEYTHIEAEFRKIKFGDLLDNIEDMLVRVSEIVMEIDSETLLKLNPEFKPLKKPFRRMEYRDALVFLRENNISKPDGNAYEFGDDIPEGAERAMLAIIDEPVMLTRFPWQIKAFYMSRCADDDAVTESVDVLLPGVGEVVGGSMRIWHFEELMAAIHREGLDPVEYKFYTDLRLYGSCPSGGYGLGFERLLTWMLARKHIRDVVAYPRYMGRCRP